MRWPWSPKPLQEPSPVPEAPVPSPPLPPETEEEREVRLEREAAQREQEHARWLEEAAMKKAKTLRLGVWLRLVRLMEKIDYEVRDDAYLRLNMGEAGENATAIVEAVNNIVDAGLALAVWPPESVGHLGEPAAKTIRALLYTGLRQEVTRNIRQWLLAEGMPEDFLFSAFEAYGPYEPDDFVYDEYGPMPENSKPGEDWDAFYKENED